MTASPPPVRRDGQIAAALLYALAGFSLLTMGDTVVKTMTGQWPGTAIAALRYVFGFAALTIILAVKEGRQGFRCPLPHVQAMRGLLVAMGSIGFFLAIHRMPIADATAITFVSPIFAALFSWALLKERPPATIAVSILCALAGTLLILRPNLLSLGANALLPLGCAVSMAMLMVFNRKAAGSGSVLLMQWLISGFAAAVLLIFTTAGHVLEVPGLHVGMPSAGVILKCGVVAFTATCSHTLIFMATERASAGRIAPMTYVQLLLAILSGIVLFGNWPDLWMLGGSVLIILGGLILWHIQVRRQSR